MERDLPSRPDVIENQIWFHDWENWERTVAWAKICGTSPVRTDHLSSVNYRILEGHGLLVIDCSSEVELSPGIEVKVGRGHTRQYEGCFSTVMEFTPGLNQYITHDQEKLTKKEKKELGKILDPPMLELVKDKIVEETMHYVDLYRMMGKINEK